MKTTTRLSAIILSAFALTGSAIAGSPAPETALPPPAPAPSGLWEFRASLPGWMAGLDGTTGVLGAKGNVDVPFEDIVSKLDMIAALNFEARHGRWGFLASGLYMEVSDAAGTPGPRINHLTLEMDQLMLDAAISYAVVDGPSCRVELLGGARYNNIGVDLTLDTDRAVRSVSGDKGWVDPYVGLLSRSQVADPVTFVLKGDVGGFGISSDLAWQAYAGLEFQISKCCFAGIGYRYMSTDYTSGGFTYDVEMNGPQLEFGFKF